MARRRVARLDPAPLRSALVPGAVLLVFVLVYGARWPLGLAVLAASPLLALLVAAPWWAARSVARFDRDAVSALARGRAASLAPRYRAALGMRMFAPPPVRAERRGLAAAESGDAPGALAAYREAAEGWEAAGLPPPVAVLFGVARAAEQLGRWDEALRALQALERLDATVPDLAARRARAEAAVGQR